MIKVSWLWRFMDQVPQGFSAKSFKRLSITNPTIHILKSFIKFFSCFLLFC